MRSAAEAIDLDDDPVQEEVEDLPARPFTETTQGVIIVEEGEMQTRDLTAEVESRRRWRSVPIWVRLKWWLFGCDENK
ncbi:hypothetical protein [Halopelagius inordinatus]|uniref:hypothetical protein n=1 Tax=Halopelagius inordinatus TaxID=553467 RepID=UPI001FE870DA|nr:hypothetical protein [Halopelagius inordinatus]